MSKEITITKSYDLEKPVEAVQMAVLLKNIVIKQNLFVPIKGKNYAMIDAWQLAGFLTGIEAVVEEPKNLSNDKEVKYSATTKLYKNEKIVGIGYAVCSSKEILKKSFDEFAILSMAQTRSISKAYRNKMGFIMKLAGFQSTPSEDMQKVGEPDLSHETPPINVPADPAKIPTIEKCSKCGTEVSEQVATFSKRVYKKVLCREDQPKKK